MTVARAALLLVAATVPVTQPAEWAPHARRRDGRRPAICTFLPGPTLPRRYYSPIDGKNLNRVFPGRADGSLTERIAHVLTREVMARADAVIDLHCGDANEALHPYVSYIADAPDPLVVERSRALAVAFGFELVKANREPDRDWTAPKYSTAAAAVLGKPAIGVELGQLAQVDDAQVARMQDGVLNAMRHLGMLEGRALPPPRQRFVVRAETVRSGATGLFTAEVDAGQAVAAGQRLGIVRDAFAALLEEPRAPFAGTVMYVTRTLPISAGEPIASIGVIADSDGHLSP